MQPVLMDSSIYIAAFRTGQETVATLRWLTPSAPVWLSAVVLEELYAGARGRHYGAVERLEGEFAKLRRILVPTLNDWAQAGKLLAQMAPARGYERIGRGRLTNDALIAMSAARRGITVLTANVKDFALLANLRPFRYQVMTI